MMDFFAWLTSFGAEYLIPIGGCLVALLRMAVDELLR